MDVFLDSNAFYKNWFLDSANFKLLVFFLNNESKDFLLSRLVVQEVNNIHEREVGEIKSELARLIKKAASLSIGGVGITSDGVNFESYDLAEIISSRVDSVKSIDYEGVSQSEVVQRALGTVKPFSAEEKGYRDTLIWISFLDYLLENNIEGDVAFISNNKHDFFKMNAGEPEFNDDLLRDIAKREVKANIKPYLNVYDFVRKNVDKTLHSIDRGRLLDDIEEFLQYETELYLNSMSNSDLSELLGAKIFNEKLTPIIGVSSDIFEGLEDPEVISVKELSGDSVYVESSFEMRRVDLEVMIDPIDYKVNADEIDSINSIYNVEIDEDYVRLSFVLRICVSGSFEYDPKEGSADNFSVDYIYNKSRSIVGFL